MANLNPDQLTVHFTPVDPARSAAAPRRYSAVRFGGESRLALSVGPEYAGQQVPELSHGAAPRLFAEWRGDAESAELHVFYGAENESGQSLGDLVRIFVQAVRYGDRHLFSAYPNLDRAPVIVHALSGASQIRPGSQWGALQDYTLPEKLRSGLPAHWEAPAWVSLNQQYDPI